MPALTRTRGSAEAGRQHSEPPWPFTGRHAQLAAVRSAVVAGIGAVVAGDAGTGKSRLVSEVAAALTPLPIVTAVATQATAGIPLGAFAHVIAAGSAGTLPAVAAQLRAAAGGEKMLLLVDDAHWLDPTSAALVHQLALLPEVTVLATVRDGEPAADPVTALWKDSLLPRLDLGPLTDPEVSAVLAVALGAAIEAGTARHLARCTGGNLLFLRELVLAGRQAGALSAVDGVWCWRGELPLTPRLRELVAGRIGTLDPPLRRLLELVAHGEPIGAELLAGLAPPGTLERAEDRGLVTAELDGQRWQVRMAHPLYGGAVRRQCDPLCTRRVRQRLAEAFEATGLRRREDVLRVAVWRLDSQSASDPEMLLAAARLARTRHDPPLAARLARAAVDAGGGCAATTVLGEMLMALGRMDEAVQVLAADRIDEVPGRLRTRRAITLAIGLAWIGADDRACRVIDAALAATDDPEQRQELLVERAWLDLFAGRLPAAVARLARARGLADPAPRVRAQLASVHARVAVHMGRSEQALAAVAGVLAESASWRDETYALPTLLEARCLAYTFTGDLAAAEQTVDDALALLEGPGRADVSVSCFGAHRAMLSRLRGELPAALARGRQDTVALRARTPYLGRCLGELAHAAALLGELTAARQALAEAQPLVAHCAFARLPVLLARAWVAAGEGDLDRAVQEAVATADAAAESSLAGLQLFALHDAVRLGAAPLVAGRLQELARWVDGPLARACVAHARAAAEDDAAGLAAVSVAFEQFPMPVHAAEAAAQAAAAHRRAGRATAARAAETRAWSLTTRAPGVSTPALAALTAPDLTARQLEVARLAASGLSNRQIAGRLTLSQRTVANHLQAVYAELGVTNRTDLTAVLPELLPGGRGPGS